jgi:hypothetical protein
MKNILNNLIKSFNGQDEGFSSRKLTAFIIIICIVATHIKWLTLGNLSQLEMVLTIDYGFIATLFGMTTYSALKTNKEKLDSPKEETPENKVDEN